MIFIHNTAVIATMMMVKASVAGRQIMTIVSDETGVFSIVNLITAALRLTCRVHNNNNNNNNTRTMFMVLSLC